MKLRTHIMFFLMSFYCSSNIVLLAHEKKTYGSQQFVATQFQKEIVTKDDNFNQKYPDLAEGFGLIGQSFQDFVLGKMLNHDMYEMVQEDTGQTVSLLDSTINQAQDIVIKHLTTDFFTIIEDAIKNGTDLHTIDNKIFTYVLQYDFFQPALQAYLSSYKNTQGQVLLIAALEKNNLQIAQFLVDLGANINLLDSCKEGTPLMYTAKNNKRDAFQFLLDLTTSDVNQIDGLGNTALHALAERNLVEMTQLLLLNRHDVNITVKNNMGNTPLDVAVQSPLQKGISDVALTLLDYPGLDMNQSDVIKVLYYAVCNEHEHVIKKIIELGYHVNNTVGDCIDPLYKAVDLGLVSIVKLLLDAGVDMHRAHCENKTAYSLAMEELPRNAIKVEKDARQKIRQLFLQPVSS
ncbi:ankyrin repeat domain-containing protein [Candidatus Chromulinivorax destructor]|uniref:Uncharacterized protein n=1 Tax=Candidatus Chromulinivorax destructor TaxID=2066483 RepID=A0A345ZAS8_9BACT|nr:ankyrin repeat domain-containing protein [Candidatus Chromulinivorax destructor]AXK60395.1 hypothetical protein C0J27_01360 [Candidatus Chromulinivorax destructor]